MSRQEKPQLTAEQVREAIAEWPWTPVQQRRYENTPVHSEPDPHEYVILGWEGIDRDTFGRFANTIRAKGYRGRYAPPYDPSKTMTNDYLQVDSWVYWYIYPRSLNRCRADQRQHEKISEPAGLF